MTSAQELLSDVIVDPNDHDPKNQISYIEDYMNFPNIFAESPEMQTCDFTWELSKFFFKREQRKGYMKQHLFCPLAAFWGIMFAMSAYCENMCIRPYANYQKFYQKLPKCSFVGPLFSCLKNICVAMCSDDKDPDRKVSTA